MSDLKPVAWMHTMDNTEGIEGNEPQVVLTFSKKNPFGRPGIDYSESFPVTSVPLYSAPEATTPAQDLAQEQAATMLIQRKKIQTLNAEIAELQKKLLGVNIAAHRLAARLCAIPPAKTIRGNDLITREAVMGFVVEWRRQWNEANEAALASSANALNAGNGVDAVKEVLKELLAVMPVLPKSASNIVGMKEKYEQAVSNARAILAAPAIQQPQDAADELLEFAATTLELYDDATMKNDYMIDSSDAAAILRALKGSSIARAALAKKGAAPTSYTGNEGETA